jgi:ABC-type polysaccharide/polyol phosphate export permease
VGTASVALQDLGGSIRRLPLALGLAADDINSKYRRTVLGPIWIMLGQAATIAGFSLVFSGLLRTSQSEYALFLAASLPVWALISTYMIEMPVAFVQAKGLLESYDMPWLLHIWRRSLGYLFVFAHQIVTLFVVMVLLRVPLHAEMLYAVPGLLIVTVAGSGIGMFLAVVGARFRDLQPAMSILVSFLFFLTPVVWHADRLPANDWIYRFNPFYYLISLIREPLLGRVPAIEMWIAAVVGAMLAFAIGFVSFTMSRGRLYHWL